MAELKSKRIGSSVKYSDLDSESIDHIYSKYGKVPKYGTLVREVDSGVRVMFLIKYRAGGVPYTAREYESGGPYGTVMEWARRHG